MAFAALALVVFGAYDSYPLAGMLQPAQVEMGQRQRAEQVALLRRQQQQIHQQEYEAILEKEKETVSLHALRDASAVQRKLLINWRLALDRSCPRRRHA